MTVLLLASAFAAGLTLAPSDGVSAIGPKAPAWASFGHAQAPRTGFDTLSHELDLAWEERRALENDAAARRVDALVAALSPVLDAGERDLLQRALFLGGILAIDEAGGAERLGGGVVVDGSPIPAAWVAAIAVSPGAPAPATADAAFAVHLYDQARTTLVKKGGLKLDPSAAGAGEVRVDGLPVSQEITLLPGAHTLSWHPVGRDPVVLALAVGGGPGFDATKLTSWLASLEKVQTGDSALDATQRTELHDWLKSPAVLVSEGGPGRLVWLVDGPARWGKPSFSVGVGVGVWGFASGDTASVACDGRVSEPTQGLGVLSAEAGARLGPMRVRVGGGLVQAMAGGFPIVEEGACDAASGSGVALVETVPWGWVSVGRRFGLAPSRELEPFVRVGGTSTYSVAQLGLGLRTAAGPTHVDVRVAAGPALNAWSGATLRTGFLGGLETSLTFGGR